MLRFGEVHITRCEFRYSGCWRNSGLSFAHVKKRRNLADGELEVVALACIPCHNKLELMKEAEMEKCVRYVIAQRVLQPRKVGV